MLIAIDASRAAKIERTGVEEYTYQLIRHLSAIDRETRYILYTDRPLPAELKENLSSNFRVKIIPFFRFWTQYRLPLELRRDKPDIAWFPASAMPIGYRGRSVVTIHGLEFEYFPEAYSFRERLYLRWSTRYAVRRAVRIMAVSNNTKQDLIKLYRADPARITVVPNGYSRYQPMSDAGDLLKKHDLSVNRYLIFAGRLEYRKNIKRLIEAYNSFRLNSGWAGKLVLSGKPGLGGEEITAAAKSSPFGKDIIFLGYLPKQELATLVQRAGALVYPSLYEGFGLPVLEAFAVDTPVMCARVSSLPEVGGEAVVYVDPRNVLDIAKGLRIVVSEPREKRRDQRRRQLAKFSWEISASGVKRVLTAPDEILPVRER